MFLQHLFLLLKERSAEDGDSEANESKERVQMHYIRGGIDSRDY